MHLFNTGWMPKARLTELSGEKNDVFFRRFDKYEYARLMDGHRPNVLRLRVQRHAVIVFPVNRTIVCSNLSQAYIVSTQKIVQILLQKSAQRDANTARWL